MVFLTREGLQDEAWQRIKADVSVKTGLDEMVAHTKQVPQWAHIAPSNLFVAEVAPIAQQLGLGIVGLETHDPQIVDEIYTYHGNLRLRVVMPPKGDNIIQVIGSVADVAYTDPSRIAGWRAALNYAKARSLQLVSITCTEKGYNIENQLAAGDMEMGPDKIGHPSHVMAKVAAMAYERFCYTKDAPISFVSLDNCSQNGERLRDSVLKIARAWDKAGLLEGDFVGYLESDKVGFPLTMIDRITPRPSEAVLHQLTEMGIQDLRLIHTQRDTWAASFVNTELVSYLVIQDLFPNGRPRFEDADLKPCNRVIMAPDAAIVDLVEKMKVGACLNPLHTTLATSGVILGYDSIARMMDDNVLNTWVKRQGYEEALPKVKDPGILVPKTFLDQVVTSRLTNAQLGDTPQRIATDTSQKIAPRYGGTIMAYGVDAGRLTFIPLAIAMWCRYLAGAYEGEKDGKGNPVYYGVADNMQLVKLSTDGGAENTNLVRLAQYTSKLDSRKQLTEQMVHEALQPILSDEKICGSNLYSNGVAQKVEIMVFEMLQGQGTVRRTIERYVRR